MKPQIWFGLALGGVLLGGCGMLKKKQPDPAPSATEVAVPTPPPPTVPATPPPVPEPTVTDEAIATPEDFEDEAFEKVSDKTYKADLDTIKKELEAAP